MRPTSARTRCGLRQRDPLGRLFACLGDEHRLRIVCLLVERSACVSETVETIGLEQPTISHHLLELRLAGLVYCWRDPADRRWIYYQANPETLRRLHDAVESWLSKIGEGPRCRRCAAGAGPGPNGEPSQPGTVRGVVDGGHDKT